MEESRTAAYRQQLESLYWISIQISRLHEMPQVLDRALGYCLELTQSAFGFIGLLNGEQQMDVAAIKGFEPSDPNFYEKFRLIPVRPSVFGVVIINRRSKISNDVRHDPDRVGQPRGHPPVRSFMGVPLQVGERAIGMIGVANKLSGYTADEERLLSTFGNQVAVAIENARLYEDQRRMIGELEQLHRDLSQAEREQVLREERARMARELHDSVSQALYAIALEARTAEKLLGEGDPRVTAQLSQIVGLAQAGQTEMRSLIFQLLPERLEREGLLAVLKEWLAAFEGRSGIKVEAALPEHEPWLPVRAKNALYHIATEALLNSVKHSNAKNIVVSIGEADPGLVRLRVDDDGIGFDSSARFPGHLGLQSMAERAANIGGRLEITSSPGEGTRVIATIPQSANS